MSQLATSPSPAQLTWQASLFGSAEPAPDAGFGGLVRHELSPHSWVDVVPGWLAGADVVFDQLIDGVDFGQRRVAMYDQMVDEPRLTAWWQSANTGFEVITEMARLLSAHYDRNFDSVGLNLYRDGNDSVAWHGDRHRRWVTNPVVALVSVGERRTLRMRPNAGGDSLAWELGHGDLLVMGGRCQDDWQHCVPKRRRAVGPRISIGFRHDRADGDQPREPRQDALPD